MMFGTAFLHCSSPDLFSNLPAGHRLRRATIAASHQVNFFRLRLLVSAVISISRGSHLSRLTVAVGKDRRLDIRAAGHRSPMAVHINIGTLAGRAALLRRRAG